MKNKNYFTKYLILVLPLLFINLNAQDQVDPLEAARLAKSAAEKAQAEADAATEAAIQSAATKAATQAREDAVQAKKDAEAKKIADAKAAEEAELDALAKAAGEEAKRRLPRNLDSMMVPAKKELRLKRLKAQKLLQKKLKSLKKQMK